MDKSQYLNAYHVVNEYSERELYRVIRDYGEEQWASRIAQFIVEERQRKSIETTFELVDVIKKAIPTRARRTGPHPARRTFQAIRIEVNNELGGLEQSIRDAVDCLNPGGQAVRYNLPQPGGQSGQKGNAEYGKALHLSA